MLHSLRAAITSIAVLGTQAHARRMQMPPMISEECTLHSGLHLKTWSEGYYDIPLNCTSDLVMISSGSAVSGVHVHARAQPTIGGIPLVTSVGVATGTDTLEVSNDGTCRINGDMITGEKSFSLGGFSVNIIESVIPVDKKLFHIPIDNSGGYVRISLWNEALMIEARLPKVLNSLNPDGLCGTFDGSEGFISRDRFAIDIAAAAADWRVSNSSDPKIFSESIGDNDSICAIMPSSDFSDYESSKLVYADRLCGHVSPQEEQINCKLDFLRTEDTSWAMAPYYNEQSSRDQCSVENIGSGPNNCLDLGGECLPHSLCNESTHECNSGLCSSDYLDWDVSRPCVCALPKVEVDVSTLNPLSNAQMRGSSTPQDFTQCINDSEEIDNECIKSNGECVPQDGPNKCDDLKENCIHGLCNSFFVVGGDMVRPCICKIPQNSSE